MSDYNSQKGYNSQKEHNLGSVFPDTRERFAREELHEAEAAYGAAESRLIRARRAYKEASREYSNFYYPLQAFRS